VGLEIFRYKAVRPSRFKVANIIRDGRTLETARREAFLISKEDRFLKNHPALKDTLERKWKGKLGLILN